MATAAAAPGARGAPAAAFWPAAGGSPSQAEGARVGAPREAATCGLGAAAGPPRPPLACVQVLLAPKQSLSVQPKPAAPKPRPPVPAPAPAAAAGDHRARAGCRHCVACLNPPPMPGWLRRRVEARLAAAKAEEARAGPAAAACCAPAGVPRPRPSYNAYRNTVRSAGLALAPPTRD